MLTALIDYNSGNLHSAVKAFEKIANENSLGSVEITSDPDIISNADRLVLPGDGAFPACKNALERSEVFEALKYAVCAKGTPFLGICVGMQLMANQGSEFELTNGLGWINGEVEKIKVDDPKLKIPHMGWNDIIIDCDHPILKEIKDGDHFYFVHSYQMKVFSKEQRLAHASYGGDITAIVAKDNMAGLQFHPEKSSHSGMKIIQNFLAWAP
jgi:glutamine amidotransferase